MRKSLDIYIRTFLHRRGRCEQCLGDCVTESDGSKMCYIFGGGV